MRAYRTTDEQIEFIVKGLDRFISYVNGYHSGCFACYQDMEMANERYKKNPETFFDDIGVSKEFFFDGLSYYRLLDIAIKAKNDIRDIHNTVIGMFINPEGNEYPIKVKEWLYDFKYFCYDDDGNFLSLEEQNNRLKKYPHFDASAKIPKSYNTQ
jgi:hypothetical protein